MPRKIKSVLSNEDGIVLAICMLMLLVITVIGIAATNTSEKELQIASNTKLIVDDLYQTESSLIDSLEDSDWLTITFLTAGETAAAYTGTADFDGDSRNDANVEVRCVEGTGTDVSGLSVAANDLPAQQHVSVPPAGSGYSLKYFETRRYGVTVGSARGNTRLQAGVWKVFNKN